MSLASNKAMANNHSSIVPRWHIFSEYSPEGSAITTKAFSLKVELLIKLQAEV